MKVAVFCGSSVPKNETYMSAAHELGNALAMSNHTLIYGGSNLGMMGAVSGAALTAGGTVVGVIPTFFSEEIILSQPVSQLVRVRSMAERKEYIIAESDVFIALPGGIGTLDEVLEVLVANQLGPLRNTVHQDKPIILYNPDGFYNLFIEQIELMGTTGFYRSGKRPKLHNAHSISEVMAIVNGK